MPVEGTLYGTPPERTDKIRCNMFTELKARHYSGCEIRQHERVN